MGSIPSILKCDATLRPRRSSYRVAASLQTGADGAPIGIGPRTPRGCALIDLHLSLLRLRLCLGSRRGPVDGTGGTAENQAGTRIARARDDRADNGAGD